MIDIVPGGLPKVVYILGHARSGSTVVTMALGAAPGVVGAGELTLLPARAWLEDVYCSCGVVGSACPFWSDVRREWTRLTGGVDLEAYVARQREFERIRYIPRVLRMSGRRDPRFLAYARENALLLSAIARVSGTAIVVDSSKDPARALALARSGLIDLVVVNLVRDARGVAWSLKKSPARDPRRGVEQTVEPRSASWTAAHWVAIDVVNATVLRRAGVAGITLRYEDFVARPEDALARIGALIGHDFGDLGRRLASGDVISAAHIVAGNRVRMDGPVRLSLDDAWAKKLTPSERRTVWRLSGWRMRRLGYRANEPVGGDRAASATAADTREGAAGSPIDRG